MVRGSLSRRLDDVEDQTGDLARPARELTDRQLAELVARALGVSVADVLDMTDGDLVAVVELR